MLKVKFNKKVLGVVNNIQNQVDKQTQEALKLMVDSATKNAQKSFDRFVIEVPSDDPYVRVSHTPIENIGKTRWKSTISCVGNQVIFIEFGAGVWYYNETAVRLYEKYLGGLNHRGTPKVDDIGHYHLAKGSHSRGLDDWWIYLSTTGRTAKGDERWGMNSRGEFKIKTHGNRPARALYRAVGMAVTRLARGKLK